jgi:adenine-specific DNA-methyltransferase
VRFIGSKQNLLSFIEGAVRECIGAPRFTFADVFCGSAAVARHFKGRGCRVIANDNLYFCSLMAKAVLLIDSEPTFERLLGDDEVRGCSSGCSTRSPYERVLAYLNSIPGEPGFIFREYTPGGTRGAEFERRYFSDENGMRIDAVRNRIAKWVSRGLLNSAEEALLVVDLMKAANRVANIAGTYGCFLREWDARALQRLELTRGEITTGMQVSHEVYNQDALQLVSECDYDVLYLDPPYTWRHYGAYYHVLETIAGWDNPAVRGKTGLRPWESTRSPFCDREHADKALEELVSRVDSCHLFLSYNSEGLIPHDTIMRILGRVSPVQYWSYPYRRYRSNGNGRTHTIVEERLYHAKVH